MTRLTIGYVPLSDASVLIAAVERGFAAAAGLDIVLVREASWANIRDKLVFGRFDAAHMLAPLAVATTLGLGHVAMPLAAPFVLNLGGNAVTVSFALAEALRAHDGFDGTLATAAAALREVARARGSAGRLPRPRRAIDPSHHLQRKHRSLDRLPNAGRQMDAAVIHHDDVVALERSFTTTMIVLYARILGRRRSSAARPFPRDPLNVAPRDADISKLTVVQAVQLTKTFIVPTPDPKHPNHAND